MPNLTAMDVRQIKLDIINASFQHAQDTGWLGRLHKLPLKDPQVVDATRRVRESFDKLYQAINKLDALGEE